MNTEKYKVVLIEDQKSHADFIKSILNETQFDIKLFNEGQKAFDFLEKPSFVPDLILVDNILPDMEGIKIIEHFMNAGYNYPFVILTSTNSINLAVKAIKVGALDYISKSLDLREELEFVVLKSIILHKERIAKISLENDLKEKESQLKELIATKEKLFSIVAHDLKNPFVSIISYTSMLLQNIGKYDNEKIEHFMKIVNSAAENTLILLENLLKWINSQTGKINFNPEKNDLSSIITEVTAILGSTANLKQISINKELCENCYVFADRNMLKTILLNLITNAIKFTNENGKIDIHTKSFADYIEISVSDNGVGMDSDTQKGLFEFDTDKISSGTEGEVGSGIGLIICKDFVTKNNGKIWVADQPKNGTTFTFSLPKA